jgi:ABC-type bacteriocin/lantibiotic exporter with double-glycine peptidase domain
MQDTAANCGPASMSNALAALGKDHSQDQCAALCKTTATDGTPPTRLLKALRGLGMEPVVIKEKRAPVAVLMLCHWLERGRPAILCVDHGGHWVAAVGLLGDRILVADSADNELVLTYSREKLVERWAGDGTCYGVVL